jgi:predicted MFS family arabinose efflux permease
MVVVMFLANAMPEFLWSNFPPIMTLVGSRFHAGPTITGLVIQSFSIGTVLTAGIAGRLIDRKGYRLAVMVGLGLLAAFATLRAIPGPFWLIVLAQAGIGATLPFVTGATSSFVVDWFDPEHESRITGICMTGVFAGLAASMVYTPWAFDIWGFDGLMRQTAIMSVALLIVAYPLLRQRQRVTAGHHHAVGVGGLAWIRGNRSLWVLLASTFLAQGCFSAIASGLEMVWSGHGLTPADAGLANALFIVGGAIGSLLLPVVQDRYNNGRTLLILCYIAPVVLTYPLFAARNALSGDILAILMGLFWLGNLPVSVTLLQRAVGSEQAGMASSLYWGFGNAGVIAMVAIFDVALEFIGWQVAVVSMALFCAGTLALTFLLPPDSRGTATPAT